MVRHGFLYAFSAGNPAFSAEVGANGELGEWRVLREGMPRTTPGVAWCAGPDRIYLALASSQREGTPVFSAAFRPQGGLGAWRMEVGLPVGLSHAAMALLDGRLVFAGGRDRRGPSARVYLTPIAAHGRLEGWRGCASLPEPLTGHALAAVQGGLTLLGGRTRDGRAAAAVYRAQLRDGQLSPWSSAAPLPSSRALAGVVVHGGAVLVLGGESRSLHDDVLVGRATDPTTGWSPASLRLPEALANAAAALSREALFLLGGVDRAQRTEVATRVLVYPLASRGARPVSFSL